MFSRYGGTEVKYQGEEHLILFRDVLAIVDYTSDAHAPVPLIRYGA